MLVPSFEEAVRARTGLMDGPRFRAAVREALVAFAGQGGVPWGRLRSALPRALFNALCEAGLEPLDYRTACRRVSHAAELNLAIARDVLDAVLVEITTRLDSEGREALRGVLPRDWAVLLPDAASRYASAASSGSRSGIVK